jgi:peptidyl-prolyl cis-trans isomerase C
MNQPISLARASGLALALLACSGKDVVAKVDGTKLRQADVAAYRGARAKDPKETLDALVDRTLLAQAGRKAGLTDDPALKARIHAAEREILAQAYVESQIASATGEDQLRKRYAAEKEKLARREIHVAHIAVHAAGRDTAAQGAAQSKASRIYARIAGGESFEKVARELSDDPATAQRGGDLGIIREGQVDAKFFEAAAALKRGEVSKPFESSFGFHVVKALEDAKTVVPPFEEVRGLLAAEARGAAESSLLASLRAKASVKLYPEHLAKPSKGGAEVR